MREKWKQSDGGVITIRAGLGKVRTSEGRLHTSSSSTQIHTGHAPQSGPRPPCRSRGRTPVLTQTQVRQANKILVPIFLTVTVAASQDLEAYQEFDLGR